MQKWVRKVSGDDKLRACNVIAFINVGDFITDIRPRPLADIGIPWAAHASHGQHTSDASCGHHTFKK